MAANPLRYAHAEALRLARWLDWAFGHFLGSTQHPRGAVLSHYRSARRELRSVLKTKRRTLKPETLGILNRLKAGINATMVDAGEAAVAQGSESAERQLVRYVEDGVRYAGQTPRVDIAPQVATVVADFDRQAAQVLALLNRGGDITAEIVGDDHRVGLLQPSGLIATASRQVATAAGAGFIAAIGRERGQDFGWMKQTIPAIDERTTETCLRAAGQKRHIDEPFHLTGEPRFADDLDWTPFHWYCRTSVALYLPQYDDGLTQALRGDVQRERKRRESERD